MRVAQVVVHNFRSIRDLVLDCRPATTLVGPNNAGKSNVLAAVGFVLTPSDKPTADDLFAFRAAGDERLWVEIEFTDLTEQERRTFARYVGSSGELRICKTATFVDGKADTRYAGYSTEPTSWWLRGSAWARLNSRAAVTAEAGAVPALADLAARSGRLSKAELEEWQENYIEAHRAELEFQRGRGRPAPGRPERGRRRAARLLPCSRRPGAGRGDEDPGASLRAPEDGD